MMGWWAITRHAGLGLALLSMVVVAPAAQALDPAPVDATPRIAVLSAFKPELEKLLAATSDRRDVTMRGVRFTTGMLEGKPVVLALSGISMVNAAMTTQMLLDRFAVRAIVFSGIAGGIDPTLGVGDVTVPARWGSYLEGTFARKQTDGAFAPPPFRPKEFENFGMIHPQSTVLNADDIERPVLKFWYEVDAGLLAAARKSLGAVRLARCAAQAACLSHDPRVVIGGNGISGSVFMDNAEFRDYAFRIFDADALDMESAAVAQVAHANAVPFIAFRSLSDLAGGDDGHNQIRTFMSLAADNAAVVVKAFLRALP